MEETILEWFELVRDFPYLGQGIGCLSPRHHRHLLTLYASTSELAKP